MRGDDQQQFSILVAPEDRVPANHPLRPIRRAVDEVLQAMSRQFDKLYAETGRPSIPPKRLFRAWRGGRAAEDGDDRSGLDCGRELEARIAAQLPGSRPRS
jgi:hypothetical protein